MGERLQSQKSYVCSFFDCKAKFSKSWKLEAHLCKHTGLVSGSNQRGAKQNNEKSGHITTADIVSVLFNNCPPTPHLRNHSPVRTVTRAFAPAISSPDMSSVTVGKSRTSKPTWFLHFLFIYFIYLRE